MTQPSRYYRAEKTADGTILLRARHPKAKQIIWGWGGDYGSTKDPGAIELYGNEEGEFHGDWTNWLWRLSPAGVESLVRSLKLELADPAKWGSTPFDQRRCRELLAMLAQ